MNFLNQDEEELRSITDNSEPPILAEVMRLDPGKKRRKKIGIEKAIKEQRVNSYQNQENFSSPEVLARFKNDALNMSSFIKHMEKLQPAKVWKPDRFSFGKRTNGKGVGLASIQGLV